MNYIKSLRSLRSLRTFATRIEIIEKIVVLCVSRPSIIGNKVQDRITEIERDPYNTIKTIHFCTTTEQVSAIITYEHNKDKKF